MWPKRHFVDVFGRCNTVSVFQAQYKSKISCYQSTSLWSRLNGEYVAINSADKFLLTLTIL